MLPNDTDSVAVECIEDIDITTAKATTAVQCKYYEKSEYNHSVIKEAVMQMLSHFKEVRDGRKSPVFYTIWGHYRAGQDKLIIPFDTTFLKENFLTYKEDKTTRYHHEELGIDDDGLAEFIRVLKVDVKATSFDDQFRDVISLLKRTFNCSDFSAEFFFYNNALRIVKELAIKSAPAERTITRAQFLHRIDTGAILFNEWFVLKRGEKAHFAALRKEYFTHLNLSSFERIFLIEIEPSRYTRPELKEFIFLLAKKYSKLSKLEPSPFCPYLYLHGLTKDELAGIKGDLASEGFKFIDGHDYLGANFSSTSLTQQANHGNGIKMKIVNSLASLEQTIPLLKGRTAILYQFYIHSPYFSYNNPQVRHITIQVNEFSHIKEII